MIPTRQGWNLWSPLEKISYSAQFAASLALLPTVLFAYLGWREARLAREDQTEFFLAEKAPRLEIRNIHADNGLLTVDLKNSGESLAKDVRIENFAVITGSSARGVKFDQIYKELFAGAQAQQGMVVGKNQSISVPLASNLDVKKELGYVPWELKVAEPNDGNVALDGTALFVVTVTYRDVKQGEYGAIANALMKPPTYQAQLARFLQERRKAETLPASPADKTKPPTTPRVGQK